MSGQSSERIDVESFLQLLEMFESFWTSPQVKKLLRSQELRSELEKLPLQPWFELYKLDVGELISYMLKSVQPIFESFEFQKFLPGVEQSTSQNISSVKSVLQLNQELDQSKLHRPSDFGALPSFVVALKCLETVAICATDFKTTIPDLLFQAINGNEKAYLALVRLDISFLSHPRLFVYLGKAHLRADQVNKDALARRVAHSTTVRFLKRRRDFFALHLLTQLGFSGLSADKWADFLSSAGFPHLASKDAVYKACKRYKVSIRSPRNKTELDK